MRPLAAVLAALLVAACSPGPSTTAEPRPVTSAKGITILANEGGVLRPIQNGARLPLRSGWVTLRLATVATLEGQLEVSVFDADGRQATADVTVDYSSIDMDHGQTTERGVFHEGCYRMPLSFAMPGTWRLVIHVVRGSAPETLTVVLPDVGL